MVPFASPSRQRRLRTLLTHAHTLSLTSLLSANVVGLCVCSSKIYLHVVLCVQTTTKKGGKEGEQERKRRCGTLTVPRLHSSPRALPHPFLQTLTPLSLIAINAAVMQLPHTQRQRERQTYSGVGERGKGEQTTEIKGASKQEKRIN